MTLQNSYYIVAFVFMAAALIIGLIVVRALSDIRTRLTSLEKSAKARGGEQGGVSFLNQIVDTVTSIAQNKFK